MVEVIIFVAILKQFVSHKILFLILHVLPLLRKHQRVLQHQVCNLQLHVLVQELHPLEERDNVFVHNLELLEVETVDELLLEIGDIDVAELGEELILERPEDVDHAFLVLVELGTGLLVAEQNESNDLGLLDQPLNHITVFVDYLFGVSFLDSQVIEPPEHLDEEAGDRLQLFHAPF